jgi:predicted nucleic acid-binding protein
VGYDGCCHEILCATGVSIHFAREYGRIHPRHSERGLSTGRTDLMIAATAIKHGRVLVTHDKDFGLLTNALPELRLEDWLI